MRVGLETFKHLLPSGKAWQLTIDRMIRKLISGLSVQPGTTQDYQDKIWGDYRPADTARLSEWENQFGYANSGANEVDRRSRLAAEWKALGGQDPYYLQNVLQAAGFPLFIHEWWVPGSDPLVTRNPNTLISPNAIGGFTEVQMGVPGVQMGRPSSQMGRGRALKYLLVDNTIIPVIWPVNDLGVHPYFVYFGAATFGDSVNIDSDRFEELKSLLFKICPAQLYIGLFVELV